MDHKKSWLNLKKVPYLVLALTIIGGIIFAVTFFTRPVEAQQGQPTITYGPTWREECLDGICTRTLWSATRYIQENEQWIAVEEASSLKGIYNITIDPDPRYNITIGDFNYTHYTDVCFISDVTPTVPITIYRYNETGNITNELEAVFLNPVANVEKCYNFTLSRPTLHYHIKFGAASTTLVLQDADTENLDDGFVIDGVGAESGAGNSIFVDIDDGAENQRDLMVKFTLDDIPASQTILDAAFGLRLASNGLDASTEGYDVIAYTVYSNYTIDSGEWTEGNAADEGSCDTYEYCWAVRPTAGYYGHASPAVVFRGGASANSGWQVWNVTDGVDHMYTTMGESNTSIMLLASNKYGTPSADRQQFYSKEWGTAAQRPYLNITYESAASNAVPYYENAAPANNTQYGFDVTNVTLNISANDTDAGDTLTVTFKNASDDAAICTNSSISVNTVVRCNWPDLKHGDQQWYVTINDGTDTNTTGDYNFSITNAIPGYNSVAPANESTVTNNSVVGGYTPGDTLNIIDATTGGNCSQADAVDDSTDGTDGSDYCEWNHDYDASGETSGEFKFGNYNPPAMSSYHNLTFTQYLSGNPTGAPYLMFYCNGFSNRYQYELTGMSSGNNDFNIPLTDFTKAGTCTWDTVVDVVFWAANSDLADDTVQRIYDLDAVKNGTYGGNSGASVDLNVTITDGNPNDVLTISFMNASDDGIICTNSSISTGTTVRCLWSGLDETQEYSWYFNVTDTLAINTSGDYNFTFDIPAADSCTCAGSGNNWEINMADNCETYTDCDLGVGNITFTGTGNWYINATVSAIRMQEPVTNQIVWMNDSAILYLG